MSYLELDFSPTKEGRNQYYTRISDIKNFSALILKSPVELVVSSPTPIKIGDGLMIPEGDRFHFIVKEVLEESAHTQRTTPNCTRQRVKAFCVARGRISVDYERCNIKKYVEHNKIITD